MESSSLIDDLLSSPIRHGGPSTPLQGGSGGRPSYYTTEAQSNAINPHHPDARNYRPSAARQLFATMKRQMIQKMRMPFSLAIEMLLPVVFVAGLLAGNSAAGTEMKPGANFIHPVPDGAALPLPPQTLATQPSVFIKERFCYNGTRMTVAEANAAVYGGNCADGLLRCDGGMGPQACQGHRLLCTDAYGSLGIPPGFCYYDDAPWYAQSFLMSKDVPSYVYDFDALVLTQWAALIANGGWVTNLFDSKAILMSGPLNFSPKNAATDALVEHLNASLPLFRFVFGAVYASRAVAMDTFVQDSGDGQWGLVDVRELSTTSFSFSIALNRSAVPFTSNVVARFSGGLASTRFRDIMNSGFVTLQTTLSNVYLTKYLNVSSASVNDAPIVVSPMGYQAYRSSVFLQIAGSALAPLTLVLSFLYTVSQLSKRLVEEKELRLREGSMVMGLGKFAFYASWILTYVIQILVSSLILTGVVKAGLIEQSDFFIVFVLYFLFALSTVLLAALLSSFFSKSRITALVVPLIYFGLSIPSFSLPDGTSRGTYVGLSLFSPTAFGIGTRLLFSYEINDGMGWGDINSEQDTVNMGAVFGLLIFDCLLYFFLTLYLDEVLPSEWGSKSHPCFCFCVCCKKKESSDVVQGVVVGNNVRKPIPSKSRTAAFFEDYPNPAGTPTATTPSRGMPDDGCTVHLQSLRKEFPSDSGVKVAVDDLDLKIFPDQITVILGHNGAGKTTSMNMITGMLPITQGDCMVYGKSAKHDLRGVRNEIGYCPQHNILWGQLTCAEHLEYFAQLKGVPSSQIEGEVIEMLTKVDLLDKKDVYSDMLSGGQKRKLSVAIAFIGGSRLILLDEPTAGMDVAARRHTWDLLKEMSVGRTVILTTHFMDEADLLGNRIAIMSKGSLHSYGSSMFLKSRLGTGYVLRVSLVPPAAGDDGKLSAQRIDKISTNITSLLRASIPDAELKEAKGQEMAFSLPMKAAPQFGTVIAAIEDRAFQKENRINGISMSVSTLEDVFVHIAEEEDLSVTEVQNPTGTTPTSSPTANHNKQQQHEHATMQMLEEVYERMGRTPCAISFHQQFVGLIKKRFHNARRDRRTIFLQVILPVLCILLAMAMATLGPPDSPELWLNGAMYAQRNQVVPTAGDRCRQIGALLDPYTQPDYRATIPNVGNQSYALSETLVQEAKAHGGSDRMIALSCDDIGYQTNVPYRNGTGVYIAPSATIALFNASGIYALPQAVAAYYNGLAGFFGTPTTASVNTTIHVASYPMPYTARQSATIDGIRNLIVGIFIMIPFTFIPSTYVAWIVKERSCKAKHLQTVSGMHYLAYWGSNFTFDILSFFLTELLAVILFAAFNRTEYIGSDTIGGTLLLFVLYGLSGITWAYFFSFLFDNHGTAQNLTMLANFLAGFALVITIYILRQIPSTSSAADVIVFFCRLIPSYCLGDGILVLASVLVSRQTGDSINIWAMDQLGWDLTFLGIEVILFGAATLLWDHPQRQLRKQQLMFDRNAEAPPIDGEDDDVRNERAEVENASPSSIRRTDVVTVRKLRKVYSNGKVAVQNVSFGVKLGEVFGFLGTNGAGKTTTMSILTSEFLPSMGHCSVGGFDVVEHAAESQQMMGFCPQFDALLDLMTCEEHLHLYAALRGVCASDTPFVVDALLTACDIQKYRAMPSKKLSGGNKRKLSVAIALIGAPKLVLLDEPSAGMDPLARRMMWDVVNFVARRSSVVLTTHHLEEVDVLAHRVGIMVDGTLKCLGSLDHLKRKFGSGYEVSIKVGSHSPTGEPIMDAAEQTRLADDVQRFMQQHFATMELLENRNLRLTFSIANKGLSLSQVFRVLQNAKESQVCPIADYTVQQSSLEQVFLRISEGVNAEDAAVPVPPLSEEGTTAVDLDFGNFTLPSRRPSERGFKASDDVLRML